MTGSLGFDVAMVEDRPSAIAVVIEAGVLSDTLGVDGADEELRSGVKFAVLAVGEFSHGLERSRLV